MRMSDWLHLMMRHTNFHGAAKVDEGPVVLLRAAENVAGFDVPVGVPDVVQPPQSPHSVAQCLQYTHSTSSTDV